MMKSVVLKRLPGGGYIKLPVDFSGIELLAELCSLDRGKLDGFLEKQQVIPNPRHRPRDILKEATNMMPWTWNNNPAVMLRKETSSSSKNNPPSPDSVLFLETSDETIMLPPAKKQKKEQKNSKTESSNYPSLRAEFKNKIVELAGSDGVVSEEKLLIEKRLTKTDLNKGQSRLSIPSKQMPRRDCLPITTARMWGPSTMSQSSSHRYKQAKPACVVGILAVAYATLSQKIGMKSKIGMSLKKG